MFSHFPRESLLLTFLNWGEVYQPARIRQPLHDSFRTLRHAIDARYRKQTQCKAWTCTIAISQSPSLADSSSSCLPLGAPQMLGCRKGSWKSQLGGALSATITHLSVFPAPLWHQLVGTVRAVKTGIIHARAWAEARREDRHRSEGGKKDFL